MNFPADEHAAASQTRPEIAVVPGDFPVEQNVFHFRPLADVMDDQVAATGSRSLIHDDSNVGNVPA